MEGGSVTGSALAVWAAPMSALATKQAEALERHAAPRRGETLDL